MYGGTGLLGLQLAFVGSNVTLFWLPSGVAVAAFALWGASMAWPLVLAIVAMQLGLGTPAWVAAPMAVGATAGPWLASRLIARHRIDHGFGSTRDFLVLGIAALVAMLVPPTTGIGALAAAGTIPPDQVARAWLGWYLGDALGVVLAAPLLIAAHAAWHARAGHDQRAPPRDRRAVVLVVVLVVGLLAIGAALAAATPRSDDPLGLVSMFALQLAIAAGAAWFGVLGTWATLAGLALAVALPIALDSGPFVRPDPDEGHWVAWLFVVLAAAFAVLIVGARRRLESVQHALARRERQMRTVLEQANAGLSITEHGRYVLVNDAFCAMLGLRRDEVLRRHFTELAHPDDVAATADVLRRCAAGPTGGVLFETRYRHRDGHWVWARVAVGLIAGDDGAAPQVVTVLMDISGLKRVEASLRRQREQLALVFEATGSGIWDHDLVTGDSYYSDSYLRILGYPPGAALVSPHAAPERLHPDDRVRVRALVTDMLDRRVPFDAEYRLQRGDGGHQWVHARGFAAWDASGKPVRMYGAIADVSARKAAETALIDSRARLSAVIDSAIDAIIAIDAQGRVVLFNPAAEALLGRGAADVLGRGMLPLVPPRMRRDALARLNAIATASSTRVRGRGVAGSHRLTVLHADGGELPVDASVSMVSLDAGRLITLVLRDARERERIAAAETAAAKAEAASRAKSDFLSRMSHELRTPLNAVLGFAQLLELDADAPLAPVQRERTRAIREAGGHLGALIDELLDLTRIESNQLRLERIDVDVHAIVLECLRLVSPAAATAGIALAPPPVSTRPIHARADRTRLRQVLVNLLSNAIKYNRRGGHVRVIVVDEPTQQVLIEVQDDGPGIAADDQARLFEPFERLGREHGDIEGSGIGLALARRLVEAMGGSIEVDSEPGEGSTFRVRLPSARRPQGSATVDEPPGPPASSAARTAPDRA